METSPAITSSLNPPGTSSPIMSSDRRIVHRRCALCAVSNYPYYGSHLDGQFLGIKQSHIARVGRLCETTVRASYIDLSGPPAKR